MYKIERSARTEGDTDVGLFIYTLYKLSPASRGMITRD